MKLSRNLYVTRREREEVARFKRLERFLYQKHKTPDEQDREYWERLEREFDEQDTGQ